MTPTDILRAMLDERGIEYETPTSTFTVAHVGDIKYRFLEYRRCGEPSLDEKLDGKIFAETEWLTPEQAIAATVGVRDYTYDEWRAINEAVGDAMEYAHEHAVMYPDKADPLWNIDEYVNRVLEVAYGPKDATIDAGTCQGEIDSDYFECKLTTFKCRSCGWSGVVDDGYAGYSFEDTDMPRHCPNCGAKVVSE